MTFPVNPKKTQSTTSPFVSVVHYNMSDLMKFEGDSNSLMTHFRSIKQGETNQNIKHMPGILKLHTCNLPQKSIIDTFCSWA